MRYIALKSDVQKLSLTPASNKLQKANKRWIKEETVELKFGSDGLWRVSECTVSKG